MGHRVEEKVFDTKDAADSYVMCRRGQPRTPDSELYVQPPVNHDGQWVVRVEEYWG
jgi:hypothetical protein